MKDGRVDLPRGVRLPEGAQVRVIVDESAEATPLPYEAEPLLEEDVLADIAMATGKLFRT